MNRRASRSHRSRGMRANLAFMIVLASTWWGCSSSQAVPAEAIPTPTSALDAPTNEILGPGDIVSVRVFREPDLSGKYRIPDQGPNEFPLIGGISMAGKTPQEVQSELTQKLGDGFLVDPQVTVFVEERNSQRVHVLGQVQKPGTFAYNPSMTVIEAITLAGGFSDLASRNSVKISRTVDGKETVIKVQAGSISSGSARNVRLLPGDIVYVPEALF